MKVTEKDVFVAYSSDPEKVSYAEVEQVITYRESHGCLWLYAASDLAGIDPEASNKIKSSSYSLLFEVTVNRDENWIKGTLGTIQYAASECVYPDLLHYAETHTSAQVLDKIGVADGEGLIHIESGDNWGKWLEYKRYENANIEALCRLSYATVRDGTLLMVQCVIKSDYSFGDVAEYWSCLIERYKNTVIRNFPN